MKIKKKYWGRGWAWAVQGSRDWFLCSWAEPDVERLKKKGCPSPEAKLIRVRISPVPARRSKRKAKRK